jgi:hypothetical protein
MRDLKTHLGKAAKTRWAKATQAEKQAAAGPREPRLLEQLSFEQRSAEMKRRAKMRGRIGR